MESVINLVTEDNDPANQLNRILKCDTYRVRIGVLKDIASLINLNHKWQKETLPPELYSKGFLSVKFTTSDFEKIISTRELVVAEYQNELIGYYLLNNICITDKLINAKKVVHELRTSEIIASSSKVALGAQVVIEAAHRGKGLFIMMLQCLFAETNTQYDFYYSSISKMNLNSLSVHLNTGWIIVKEDEYCYYILLNLIVLQ